MGPGTSTKHKDKIKTSAVVEGGTFFAGSCSQGYYFSAFTTFSFIIIFLHGVHFDIGIHEERS
jgi:hypothetical protein